MLLLIKTPLRSTMYGVQCMHLLIRTPLRSTMYAPIN